MENQTLTADEIALIRESLSWLCDPDLIGMTIDTVMNAPDLLRKQIAYTLEIIEEYTDEAQDRFRSIAQKTGA